MEIVLYYEVRFLTNSKKAYDSPHHYGGDVTYQFKREISAPCLLNPGQYYWLRSDPVVESRREDGDETAHKIKESGYLEDPDGVRAYMLITDDQFLKDWSRDCGHRSIHESRPLWEKYVVDRKKSLVESFIADGWELEEDVDILS